MNNKPNKKEQKKRGKPISLYPLEVEEALEGLLKVKSPPKKKLNTNKEEKS